MGGGRWRITRDCASSRHGLCKTKKGPDHFIPIGFSAHFTDIVALRFVRASVDHPDRCRLHQVVRIGATPRSRRGRRLEYQIWGAYQATARFVTWRGASGGGHALVSRFRSPCMRGTELDGVLSRCRHQRMIGRAAAWIPFSIAFNSQLGAVPRLVLSRRWGRG